MKAFQKILVSVRNAVIVSAVAITTTSAFAHTTLQSAIPAVNSKVTAPSKLTLTFGEPVMLMGLKLTNAQKKNVPLNFKVSSVMNKSFEIAVPKLAKSTYTESWTIMGDDGHNMSGSFQFTVK
ncbi:MAG: copper resistance protein CopC [Gammaproteobacteria bacterium]|jgi:methionine-rich copper-binding protein CopC|nr:copper resistance protein CopC [Gammaproteobacteria bacterium]